MDPALGRFVTNAGCQAIGVDGTGKYYNPNSTFTKCQTDDAQFARLIAQYGFALAPTAMHSARTTGYGGFEIAIEGAYTDIDDGGDKLYWQLGTQGPQDESSKLFSFYNRDPDGFLQVYMLKIRKGFPFGLELTGNVGYMANSNIVTGGADVRLSLFEGFRTGIPAIFPELAAGGGVRTITGTEEFQLTVVGVDGQLSKPIPIAGTLVLTPYVGYQWIRIFGDSGLIDLTPNTDAVNYCGYRGANSPAVRDPKKVPTGSDAYDGQPVCETGSSADFNNTVVFSPVRLNRHRINFGMQMRFQMVKLGIQGIVEPINAEEANEGEETDVVDETGKVIRRENIYKGMPKQWSIVFDVGAVF